MRPCCAPDLSAVRRLLGMRDRVDEETQKVMDEELAVLQKLVEPIALVQNIRADEAFHAPMRCAGGEEAPGGSKCSVRGKGMSAASKCSLGDQHAITADLFQTGEEMLAVLLTVGTAGDYVAELFSAGGHLRALVADALLGAWLFAMDEAVQREIGRWCTEHGFGVCRRLEAPEDFPGELQRVICKRLDSERRAGVHVNDGCMLVPEKSMCYLLRLDRDCGRLAMGHDCARCGRRDCGARMCTVR